MFFAAALTEHSELVDLQQKAIFLVDKISVGDDSLRERLFLQKNRSLFLQEERSAFNESSNVKESLKHFISEKSIERLTALCTFLEQLLHDTSSRSNFSSTTSEASRKDSSIVDKDSLSTSDAGSCVPDPHPVHLTQGNTQQIHEVVAIMSESSCSSEEALLSCSSKQDLLSCSSEAALLSCSSEEDLSSFVTSESFYEGSCICTEQTPSRCELVCTEECICTEPTLSRSEQVCTKQKLSVIFKEQMVIGLNFSVTKLP